MQQKNPDTKGYPEFDQLSLPDIEKNILKFWEESKTFEKSVSSRPEDKHERFVFYEGPPSANGKPGIHHVLSRTIKDLFCRFKTLQGYRVERKAGWDTHGLPVELNVEKQLGITKADIGTKISVAEYNRLCREDVMRFTDVWNDLTTKMGYWVDLDNPYITYENNYIESLWALLKMLYDKGLLYEGYTIQPYSPAAGTGLSSHELNQPGCYKEVKDVSAVAMFKLAYDEKSKFLFDGEAEDVRFLAWTTTPWTLPSNTALAVGRDIIYVKLRTFNPYTHLPVSVILAKDLMKLYFNYNVAFDKDISEAMKEWTSESRAIYNGIKNWITKGIQGVTPEQVKDFVNDPIEFKVIDKGIERIERVKRGIPSEVVLQIAGSGLVGISYEQLLPYVKPQAEGAFRVAIGDFVTITDGTGIVHIAPTFGSDDFRLANKENIPPIVASRLPLFELLIEKENPEKKEFDLLHGALFSGGTQSYISITEDENLKKGIGEVTWDDLRDLTFEDLGETTWDDLTRGLKHVFKQTKFRETITREYEKIRQGYNVPLVDKQGKFIPEVNDPVFPLAERYIKEAYLTDEEKFAELQVQKEKLKDIIPHLEKYMSVDDLIVLKLKLENKLFKTEKYEHNYPHCWRTDKPVIYYPLDSWFIKTTAVKDRLIELNKTINWKPAHTGEGRFGQWLENLVDWNLSRSRYWGTPLPIWKTEDGSEEMIIGSVAELYEEVVKAKELGHNKFIIIEKEVFHNQIDLHKPLVDEIVLISKSGKPMKRVSDLIDVWFDSGAMPYAQWHWPFGPLAPEGGTKAGDTEKDASIRWKTANLISYKLLKEFAAQNRKNSTVAEEALWTVLSGKKLSGYKFRRQHIIDEAIVDFVCITKKLVVEVDGGYHNAAEQQELDNARTEYLKTLGFKVIRFTNEHVIGDLDNVLNKIQKELAYRPTVPKEGHDKAPFGGLGAAFPADFIAEGVDQTRGWFFTLHVLGVMLFDSVAYKNVVSNGLLLDKNGNKMSKRLGNIVDPFEAINKYSADATRWYMMRNSDPWDNMKFDMAGVQDVIRAHFGTLYNTYSFFALYANIDGWKIDENNLVPFNEKPELDRWIISKLQSLILDVTGFYEDYEPTKAARAIEAFVDEHLSNWYVRLSRRRFWKGEMSADKVSAYETLYECLTVVAQFMSPISPFFSEWLHKNMTDNPAQKPVTDLGIGDYENSVHLTFLTKVEESKMDKDLEERMELAQKACSLVLSLRKKEKIKVRQPLQKIMIPVLSDKMKEQFQKVESYILSEVNVKAIDYISDTSGIVKKKIKPNFRELGKKVGGKMKSLQAAIALFTQDDLQILERDKVFVLNLDGEKFNLEIGDVEIQSEDIPGWLVASEGHITVALDVTITDELRNEGTAREFVNKVQNIRKDKNFQVLDRIRVSVVKNKTFELALTQFKDYISNEILAKEILLVDSLNEFEEVELNEDLLQVNVELAPQPPKGA